MHVDCASLWQHLGPLIPSTQPRSATPPLLPGMSPPSADPAQGFAHKLALSAVAASVAETATFPLDLLKTRLQLAGQQQLAAAVQAQRPRLLSVAVSIVRTEGFLGL